MRGVYRAIMSIIACGLFEALYGAIAGAAYGTLVFPLAGTIVGLVLGCVFGFAAGIIGGSLGGPLGWSIGGLTLPLISGWESQNVDIHLLASWLWIFFPGLIGTALGLAIGRDLQRESPSFPAVRWLRETTRPCAIGEWLWWRRGISNASLNPAATEEAGSWFQPPGTRMRWVLVLCLAGLLLATKSCHDTLREITWGPSRDGVGQAR